MKLFSLIPCLLFSICLFGQQEDSLTFPSSVQHLEELVIQGNKLDKPQESLPGHVSILSRKDIILKAAPNGSDLVLASGEAYVQKSQLGGGSPMLRGQAANRILLVYDGVRMNNAIFRSGNLQNSMMVDPHVIQQMEIHHGPNSLLYGSDALGGVIHYTGFLPSFTDSLEIGGVFQFDAGSAARYTNGHGSLNFSSRNAVVTLAFSRSNFNDLRMGSNGRKDYLRPWYVGRLGDRDTVLTNLEPQVQKSTGYSQSNLQLKVAIQLHSQHTLRLTTTLAQTGWVPRYDRLIQTSNGSPTYANWSYGPQRWFFSTLAWEIQAKTAFFDQSIVQMAWQHFSESRYDRKFQSTTARWRFDLVQVPSINWDMKKAWTSRSTGHYGLDAQWNRVFSNGFQSELDTSSTTPINSRYPDNSRWDSYGLYYKHVYRPTAQWQIQGGVRLNNIRSKMRLDTELFPFPISQVKTQFWGWSGSLSAQYKLNPRMHLNAISSTGFRAPNIDDLAKVFDSEPGKLLVPNPNLKPEIAWNNELGFNYKGGALNLKGGLFHTHLFQFITRQPDELQGVDSVQYDGAMSAIYSMQNADKGSIYGVFLGAQYNFFKNWKLFGNMNVQFGQLNTVNGKEAIRHVAPHFGNLGLRWSDGPWNIESRLDFMLEHNYTDLAPSEKAKPHLYATNNNGMPFSPAWMTWNIQSHYQIKEKVQIRLGIDNIMDIRYRPYSSGITAPGRNFSVGLRVQI